MSQIMDELILEEKKTKQKEDKRREIATETLKKRPILIYCRDKE